MTTPSVAECMIVLIRSSLSYRQIFAPTLQIPNLQCDNVKNYLYYLRMWKIFFVSQSTYMYHVFCQSLFPRFLRGLATYAYQSLHYAIVTSCFKNRILKPLPRTLNLKQINKRTNVLCVS